jgi:hypothetical protein
MHGAGRWIRNAQNVYEFITAPAAFPQGVIDQLTDYASVVPLSAQEQAIFDSMPSRLFARNVGGYLASLSFMLGATQAQFDSYGTFVAQENRVSINGFISSTGVNARQVEIGVSALRYRALERQYRAFLAIIADDDSFRITGESLATEDIERRLTYHSTTTNNRFIFAVSPPDGQSQGIINARNTRLPVLGSFGDVQIRVNFDPIMSVGVMVGPDDSRLDLNQHQGYHFFVASNPFASPHLQATEIIHDVELFLDSLATRTDVEATPSSNPANVYPRDASGSPACYFSQEVDRLSSQPQGTLSFSRAGAVVVSPNGEVMTVPYTITVQGQVNPLSFHAEVNWRTGETTIYQVPGAGAPVAISTGIGLSPNTMLRGSNAEARLTSASTESATNTHEFGMRLPDASDLARPGYVTPPNAPLHLLPGGAASELTLHATSRVIGGTGADEIFATFRITIPADTHADITITSMGLVGGVWGDLASWTVRNVVQVEEYLHQLGNMVVSARSRGYDVRDTSGGAMDSFDVRDAGGNTIASINKGAQGRFVVTSVTVPSFTVPGATITLPFSHAGRGYMTPEQALDAIINTRAWCDELRTRGYVLSNIDVIVKVGHNIGTDIYVTGTLAFPAAMGLTQTLDVHFNTETCTLQGVIGGLPTAAIAGGTRGLTALVTEFTTRYAFIAPPTFRRGESQSLVIGGAANRPVFGSTTLDGTATIELDLTNPSNRIDTANPHNTVLALALQQIQMPHLSPVDFATWPVTSALLEAFVEQLNVLDASGVPIANIVPITPKSSHGRIPRYVDSIALRIDFPILGTTKEFISVWLDVRSRDSVRYAATSQVRASGLYLIPQDTEYANRDGGVRYRLDDAFICYMDGTPGDVTEESGGIYSDGGINRRGIRFDQWLVHHMLGTSYTQTPYGTSIDHAAFDLACEMAGIDQSNTAAGIASVMRWFLLYASNAGNVVEDGHGNAVVSFRQWCLTQFGVNIDNLPDDEAAWNWLFEKLGIYGRTVAYLSPASDPQRKLTEIGPLAP